MRSDSTHFFFEKKGYEGEGVSWVIKPVMNVVVCSGSIWDIIAMNGKRLFQRESFSLL
jgi:hypothetical protein